VSDPLVVRSEFALVEVSLAPRGSGEVLQIIDVPGGRTIQLDALELEGLCALGAEDLRRLGSPEWRMRDDGVAPILSERPPPPPAHADTT
jgi:hypothetical protein